MARAIPVLSRAGFDLRRMIVYVLYNFHDTPDEFLERLCDLMEWSVVAYSMRFEPLGSLKKNQHVGQGWSPEQLEMVARARWVIGYGGAFPPYEGLRKKFVNAKDFEEAFTLRPTSSRRLMERAAVGQGSGGAT